MSKKTIKKDAHVAAGDPRVKALLDEFGAPYEIDEDGDFLLTMKVGDEGRTQAGTIYSKTLVRFGREIRKLSSVGLATEKGPFSARIANALLQANYAYILGAWEAAGVKDGVNVAFYAAYVDADADINNLMEAFAGVLEMADQVERTISGEDEF